jgi:large subunit ribosomal protein L9
MIVAEKGEIVKVTFLEDVPNVARVGQTRMVADGYARNYLLPRRLAVIADSQAAAAVEGQLKKKVKQRELEDAEMAKVAEKIEGTQVTIKAKVGENEKLYGSVTAADIAVALTGAAGREIDKKKVELVEPIRQTGSYKVVIRLAHEITAAITVKVISEDAVEAPAEPAAAAEKPARKPKAEKAEGATAAEKPARKPKAEKAEGAAAAEKPAKKPKAEKPEAAEGAEKPAKKPRAKSAKKAKPAEAAVSPGEVEAAAPEAEEKASGE